MKNTMDDSPKTISGIDSLYYFQETNSKYPDLFTDIVDQIEYKKQSLERNKTLYKNSDIMVVINDQKFSFLGKNREVYWLGHSDSLYRIGFKDHEKNIKLHNIQIQLDARGIYTFGTKAVIKLIDNLLEGYVTGLKPITRVDLNIFVQSNLSWLNKDMFVTRKRKFKTISTEIASKYEMQTLYIGEDPLCLRIYNKSAELLKSKKSEMMWEYFRNHDFEPDTTVFNVELEIHRDVLNRSYGINTIDDLFGRAEALFKECMNEIRLIDLDSITENEKNSNNKYRAETLPLWNHLKDSYKLHDFLQMDMSLQRIKRNVSSYSETEAVRDYVAFIRRCDINGVFLDEQFYGQVKYEMEKLNRNADKFNYRLMAGKCNVAYFFPQVHHMNNEELLKHYEKMLIEVKNPYREYDRLIDHIGYVYDQLIHRGINLQSDYLSIQGR
jgi:hypothetical protein